MQKEPLWTVGGITAVAAAVVAVLVAFGVPLTDGQTEAVLGLVAIVAPLAVAAAARGRVSSPATVARIRADQSPGE